MNNTTDEEVVALIKELEELQIKIGVVTNRLRSIQRDNEPTSETPTHNNTTEDEAQATKPRRSKRHKEVRVSENKTGNKSKTPYVYKKGDKIRVKNPTRKQRVTIGTVNKHRRNGYVDFTLDDGITTCRAYKNVELICKAEDRNKF